MSIFSKKKIAAVVGAVAMATIGVGLAANTADAATAPTFTVSIPITVSVGTGIGPNFSYTTPGMTIVGCSWMTSTTNSSLVQLLGILGGAQVVGPGTWYTPTAADAGKYIYVSCVAKWPNGEENNAYSQFAYVVGMPGSSTGTSNPPTPGGTPSGGSSGSTSTIKPVAFNQAITGAPGVGNTLTATVSNENPANASLSYQWYFQSTAASTQMNIVAATGRQFTVTSEYAGDYIGVQVTASASGFTSTVHKSLVLIPSSGQSAGNTGGSGSGTSSGSGSAPSTSPNAINTNSEQAVIDAYNNLYLPAYTSPVAWNGNVSTCNPGTPNPTVQKNTFQMINFLRAMDGLSPVTEDLSASQNALQAALMMSASVPALPLTHSPGTNYKCYTQAGADAAGNSNLSFGTSGAQAAAGYMHDSDSGNAPMVAHRRWILDPLLTQMGSGSTSNSGALTVMGTATSQSNANPGFIPWPSAGYFPYEMTLDSNAQMTAWSVQSTSANFANASVSVKKNGSQINVSRYPDSSVYGGGDALVWQMPSISKPPAGGEDDYSVTITGITGGASSSYSYVVKMFNATTTTGSGSGSTGSTGSGSAGNGSGSSTGSGSTGSTGSTGSGSTGSGSTGSGPAGSTGSTGSAGSVSTGSNGNPSTNPGSGSAGSGSTNGGGSSTQTEQNGRSEVASGSNLHFAAGSVIIASTPSSRTQFVLANNGQLEVNINGYTVSVVANAGVGSWFTIQADGNFVLYRSNGSVAWASNSRFGGNAGGWVTAQADGNVVLYSNVTRNAVWQSGTSGL